MSRVFFLIREAMVNLRRNLLIVVGAVVAVFFSLTLAFSALVFNEMLRLKTIAWEDGIHMIVFLNDDGTQSVPAGAHQALLEEVRSWDEVKDALYVDKAEAWVEFQQIFADQMDSFEGIDPSILPASIRIELVSIDLVDSVQFRLEQDTITVRRIQTASEQLELLQNINNGLRVFGLAVSVILGVSAVVLISNTIRLAIYARRDEVEIMRLVGASNWYIRVPFLLEGLIEGLVGAALSVLAVWVASDWVADLTSNVALLRLSVSNSFFASRAVLLLLFGAAAGVIGSLLGLSRYLRESEGIGADVPTGVA